MPDLRSSFSAKLSPTFGSFGSAVIGALLMSTNCLALEDTFRLTLQPILSKKIKLNFTRQTSQQRGKKKTVRFVCVQRVISICDNVCSASRMRSMPDSRSSLPSTHNFATTLPLAGASASNNLNQRICFSAKLSTSFASIGSTVIGALSMSILRQYCLFRFGGYLTCR